MNLISLFVFLLLLPLPIFSQGKLIEVCGVDGVGKTTFVQDLQQALNDNGHKVVVLRPTSCDRKFVEILKGLNESNNSNLSERIEKFKSDYFFLEFLKNQASIKRYMDEGFDVICDRYFFSFITYRECFGQGLAGEDKLLDNCIKADHIFLMTVPVSVSMERIEKRDIQAAHENPEFLSRAHSLFLNNAWRYPGITFLDGTKQRAFNLEKALSTIA